MNNNENNNGNDQIEQHYVKVILETARNTFNIVRQNTGLPEHPKKGDEISPVPVYESDAAYSLLTCVSGRVKTEILWPAVPADVYVPAYYKRYRDENRVPRNEVIVIAENYCHARFFAAKELMHCMLDDDNYPATNSIQSAKELIDELSAANNRISCTPQTMVDEIAWLGAMHYLIPESWIPLLKQMVQALVDAGPATAQQAHLHVARHIRVPELLLKLRLKQAK